MFVNLKHSNGLQKQCKIGFSWTYLFFTFIVPAVRGDVKWFIVSMILALLTFGIGNVVLAFFYNKIYIQSLIEKGYEPADDNSKRILISKGIIVTK